jgi:eukaryotic-like serine/threonine-protein kinase
LKENLLICGKYRLLRKLGSGGMGEVWLARNEATDREFAIKFLLAEHAADAEMLTRFLREAKVSGRVRHPGVVEVFDVLRAPELDGAALIVMEVLHGASLHDVANVQQRLPLRFVLDVAIAIAHALGALHEKGVIHRDIKPSNIFLHKDGAGAIVPKLLDFGISKLTSTTSPSMTTEEAELTRSGTIVGSPRYISPEQAAGRKDVDARADVHGLGVAIWTCVAGYSPFDTSNYNNMIVSVIATDRRPLCEVVPAVPREVSDVVARAIDRDRRQRYADGHAFARALEEVRVRVADGPSLDTPAWLDAVMTPGAAAPDAPASASADPSRSIGAVSVSFDDTNALGNTKLAGDVKPLAAPAPAPVPPATASPGSASSLVVPLQPRRWGRVLLGGALACAAFAAFAVVRLRAPSPSAAVPPSVPASVAAAIPTVPPPPPAEPVTLATVDAAAPSALATVPPLVSTAPPKKGGARPVVKPGGPSARPVDSADPHRGVTTSGL